MTKVALFFLLNAFIGNPLVTLAVMFLAWWAVDRVSFGVLPDPVRGWRRWQRRGFLEGVIAHNPHDRRARLELAGAYVDRRAFQTAIDVLKPSLVAGDDDAETLWTMGVACYGAGRAPEAEVFLAEAAASDPGFRLGAIDLELGRGRLAHGDAAKAREALERFLVARRGSVEGRVLLARALDALGDGAAADRLRDEAWREYLGSPLFRRRAERWWAWRAKPSRPLLYLGVALVAVTLAVTFVRPMLDTPRSTAIEDSDDD